MEAELARLLGEACLDDAKICGRQILSRWPDSEAGRYACRNIEEISRGAAAQRLVLAPARRSIMVSWARRAP